MIIKSAYHQYVLYACAATEMKEIERLRRCTSIVWSTAQPSAAAAPYCYHAITTTPQHPRTN